MKYFLDTEFIEDGHTIDLISIGIISEDDREFYALNLDCDWSKASDWVKENVLASLPPKPALEAPSITKQINHSWYRHYCIGEEIIKFIGDDPTPVFWGEWCSYDWVTLCQLYGPMMELPKGWPMRCCDVVQLLEDELSLSQDDWPASLETDGNHNALMGAHTVKARWEWCQKEKYPSVQGTTTDYSSLTLAERLGIPTL